MSDHETSGIARHSAIATAGTAASRITGFLRLVAMIYALGVAETRLADTYTLANTTPNIIYELVLGGVLSGVLLRVYVEVRDTQGQEEAWKFITRLARVTLVLLGAVALIGMAAAPFIIRAYTALVPAHARVLQETTGTLLLVLFIPQVVFYGLNTISTAVLRAHRRFGVFMFAPVINNLIVAGAFVAFALLIPVSDRTLEAVPREGLLLLGLGTTLGVVALGGVPWLYSRRLGRKAVPGAGFRDPRFRRLLSLSIYTLGYVAANQLGLFVTIALANRIQGGVAAREGAFVLFQLPHGLLAVSISMVVGTSLAEAAVRGDKDSFGSHLVLGLRAIAFVVLPAVAGYVALAPGIVKLLLEHGVATGASTELVATVLRAYAVGLLFFSGWHLLLGAFQGLGDTRTPMLINFAAVGLQIATGVGLFTVLEQPRFKVAGLALAHALAYVLAFFVGMRLLRKRLGGLDLGPLASTVARALPSAVAVGAAAWGVGYFTRDLPGGSPTILLPVGVGLLVYAAAARVLRMEEMKWVTDLVRRPRIENPES